MVSLMLSEQSGVDEIGVVSPLTFLALIPGRFIRNTLILLKATASLVTSKVFGTSAPHV
jgi:hypothetical protein